MPKDPKWRNVNTNSPFLKKVVTLNGGALSSFFQKIGFTKTSETTFKFEKVDLGSGRAVKAGNLRAI